MMKPVFLSFIIACLSVPAFAQTEADASTENMVEATPDKTGVYIEPTRLDEIIGADGAKNFAGIMDPDHEIEFYVYAPETYDAAKPAGLLVYVSPTLTGRIPDRWKEVLEKRNLIWVSVSKSGNRIPYERRIAEAALSPVFATSRYNIDARRIYLSGFSGGGRISAIVSALYPEMYKGTIFICGVDPWRQTPPEEKFDLIKENRFVFLTGTVDYNNTMTREAYRAYQDAGVKKIKFMNIPNLDHSLPDQEKLDEALSFLDEGLGIEGLAPDS